MLRPECSQFSLGPPLISVDALVELRELLISLPLRTDCDKASPTVISQGGVDETIGEAALSTNEPSALQCASNSNAQRPAKGTVPGSDGATYQGSGSKKRAANKRRRE